MTYCKFNIRLPNALHSGSLFILLLCFLLRLTTMIITTAITKKTYKKLVTGLQD